ncbi:MAG: class II D-tagatose-bisphosphate aldolase, non-catalytic subunit [Bacteroidetes bacterium]|nr:class II D-tagatose-bisphosphate aldolase, non-catalytic subunit [Bacteroidota bacterium]
MAARRHCGAADVLVDLLIASPEPFTYLAVCPNSIAVARAALAVSARLNFPLFYAATLNQVDRVDGYTGWTPASFSAWLDNELAAFDNPPFVIRGLDHGGPWKKDLDYLRRLDTPRAMAEAKKSIRACLQAGYELLHIDTTEDPELHGVIPVDLIVTRTVELIRFAEQTRAELGLPPIAYEVGTEEVSGGLTTRDRFTEFVDSLRDALSESGLKDCWPAFFVGDVGTNLHTTHFESTLARSLDEIIRPTGALLKGHYTDFVDSADAYPAAGMGAANIGPELSSVEYGAVIELAATDKTDSSGIVTALRNAVIDTGRWRKWLLEGEEDAAFDLLSPARQEWLLATGSRYVWSNPAVAAARAKLCRNLDGRIDGEAHIQGRIESVLTDYAKDFRLAGPAFQDALMRYARD